MKDKPTIRPEDLACPSPIQAPGTVLLAHGGGGRLMHRLIEDLLLPAFGGDLLRQRHDGAVFSVGSRLAFTTDSYVVRPLFFPGGDIGSLAVHGTVNDLVMCGARPLYLSVGLILEEGLALDTLRRVVESMKAAARQSGVEVVTGDTKVVDRGKGDGIFINTSGIGVIEHDVAIRPDQVCPGDVVVISGDIGRHGIAIMNVREGLEFETQIESDSAPLVRPVLRLLSEGVKVHCLRDLTRGGLASGLIEIAEASGTEMQIDESALSVREDVRGACELLGLDPMYVANEGRFVAVVPESEAARALELLTQESPGVVPSVIGRVVEGRAGRVTLKSRIGVSRIVDMLSGEQLPRIC